MTGFELIEQKKEAIFQLCERYGVERLYFFGSIITKRFSKKSDVDVQVIFHKTDNPVDDGGRILNFWDDLEIIFDRKVDLISRENIRNPYLKMEIEKTKNLFYESTRSKIFV